jgi:alkylated DNA repair dioxygenase AlkB
MGEASNAMNRRSADRARIRNTDIPEQSELFPADTPASATSTITSSSNEARELPLGFSYFPDFLSAREEADLLKTIEGLSFQDFDFHGYKAKRRVIEFGYEYDFTHRSASVTTSIPEFLFPVRERAASIADLSANELVEGIITEYPIGAAIGWHRDVPQFETVIGISLASACRMRFKPMKGGKISSQILEPRSAYVMHGPVRWKYQHSIPAVKELRYSITFRNLREKK